MEQFRPLAPLLLQLSAANYFSTKTKLERTIVFFLDVIRLESARRERHAREKAKHVYEDVRSHCSYSSSSYPND